MRKDSKLLQSLCTYCMYCTSMMSDNFLEATFSATAREKICVLNLLALLLFLMNLMKDDV